MPEGKGGRSRGKVAGAGEIYVCESRLQQVLQYSRCSPDALPVLFAVWQSGLTPHTTFLRRHQPTLPHTCTADLVFVRMGD